MSARLRWRWAVTSRRISATLRLSQIAGGNTISESSDRRQLSATMAIDVPTTPVTFEAIEVAVEVTTDCMPPMSFVSRDWTSPPRVRVKKPSDWRCRWPKTLVRRPCMTFWPTVVDSHVCNTPSIEVEIVTPSMPATSQSSRLTFWWGSASSISALMRNGVASEISDDAVMSSITMMIGSRYGENRAPTRRSETGDSRSWARSAGSTLAARGPRSRVNSGTRRTLLSWAGEYFSD